MEGVGSFLFALILTGLLAALARLVLPERFSSLGRLFKALCGILTALILLSPVLKLLSDAENAISEWEGRFVGETAVQTETDNAQLIAREAGRMIEADLAGYLAEKHPGFSCTAEILPAEGINPDTILISYGKEGFPEQEVGEYLNREYGLNCRFSGPGAEEE